jgi:hypothetical protein
MKSLTRTDGFDGTDILGERCVSWFVGDPNPGE